MNGAELACGAVLRVEPVSSSDKQSKPNEIATDGLNGNSSRSISEPAVKSSDSELLQEAEKRNSLNTEDLDEFFDSL